MTQLELALSTSSTAHLPHSSLAKNHQVNPNSLYISHFVQRNHCCLIRQGGSCSHSPTHPRGVRGQILWPLLRNSAVLPPLPPRALGSGTNLFSLIMVTRVIFPAQLSEGSLPRCNLLKDPLQTPFPTPRASPWPSCSSVPFTPSSLLPTHQFFLKSLPCSNPALEIFPNPLPTPSPPRNKSSFSKFFKVNLNFL